MTISPRPWSRTAAKVSCVLALLCLPSARGTSTPLPVPDQSAPAAPQAQLAALLAKAAEYCRRLEGSAFDFVCREEISEKIDPSLDVGPNSSPPKSGAAPFLGPTVSTAWTNKIKRTFVSDLRCQRADGTIHETRTPLEENGKETVGSAALPGTPAVTYETAFLGPVGLFGEHFQPDYDFTIAGEAKVGKTKVLVIDARPRPGAPPSRDLYGKAWVDPATGDILKIEWSESRVGRFDIFERRGKLYNRKPRLVITSEFSAEKNGIRFPSRMSIEEAYLNDAGRAAVRSRTEVVCKDFKFFTVEVEVHD